MTTVEERISALESKLAGHDVRLVGQEAWLKTMDEKLDLLIAAMNVGKGVWFAMLKMGAIAGFIVGAAAAFNSYFHWWK